MEHASYYTKEKPSSRNYEPFYNNEDVSPIPAQYKKIKKNTKICGVCHMEKEPGHTSNCPQLCLPENCIHEKCLNNKNKIPSKKDLNIAYAQTEVKPEITEKRYVGNQSAYGRARCNELVKFYPKIFKGKESLATLRAANEWRYHPSNPQRTLDMKVPLNELGKPEIPFPVTANFTNLNTMYPGWQTLLPLPQDYIIKFNNEKTAVPKVPDVRASDCVVNYEALSDEITKIQTLDKIEQLKDILKNMLKGKAALEAMKYILNKDPPVNDITNLIGSVVIAVETIETFNDIIFVKKVITSIMVARPDITIKFGDNHAKPKRKKK